MKKVLFNTQISGCKYNKLINTRAKTLKKKWRFFLREEGGGIGAIVAAPLLNAF